MAKISRTLSLNENQQKFNSNDFVIEKKIKPSQKSSKLEYFLPTTVRFEIHDVREINLEKSTAAISGNFFIEIHYNNEVKELIRQTN